MTLQLYIDNTNRIYTTLSYRFILVVVGCLLSPMLMGQTTPQTIITVYLNEQGRPVSQSQAKQYVLITPLNPNPVSTNPANSTTASESFFTLETFTLNQTLLSRSVYKQKANQVDWQTYGDPTFTGAYREGNSTEYYPTGQLKSEGEFHNGRGQGIHRRYYQTGELLSQATMEASTGNTQTKVFFENGDLKLTCQTKKGKPDGEWIEYYPGAVPKLKLLFEKGTLMQTIHYDEQGNQLDQANSQASPSLSKPAVSGSDSK